MLRLLLLVLFSQIVSANAQITRIKIDRSTDTTGEVVMRLTHRFQSYNWTPKHKFDHYDTSINSPKSVKYALDGSKFYVQSLEGYTTSIYDTGSKRLIKTLLHGFTAESDSLFKDGETTIYNYPYKQNRKHKNVFLGKPVEPDADHEEH